MSFKQLWWSGKTYSKLYPIKDTSSWRKFSVWVDEEREKKALLEKGNLPFSGFESNDVSPETETILSSDDEGRPDETTSSSSDDDYRLEMKTPPPPSDDDEDQSKDDPFTLYWSPLRVSEAEEEMFNRFWLKEPSGFVPEKEEKETKTKKMTLQSVVKRVKKEAKGSKRVTKNRHAIIDSVISLHKPKRSTAEPQKEILYGVLSKKKDTEGCQSLSMRNMNKAKVSAAIPSKKTNTASSQSVAKERQEGTDCRLQYNKEISCLVTRYTSDRESIEYPDCNNVVLCSKFVKSQVLCHRGISRHD